MRFTVLSLWLLLLAGGVAHADRPRGTSIWIGKVTPPDTTPSSRLIYLHRCLSSGCLVTQGTDDSRTDHSSIAQGEKIISAFRQSDIVWNDLVSCVKDTFAPFAITVTDVEPGNVPHFENIVGGKPGDLRDDIQNAGGVAPASCVEVPNAMSFTFDVYGPDPYSLCWTASQEVAHAFGLEHEIVNSDPMTYLDGPLPKRFQAVDAKCGERAARPCACGNATQNSYLHILGMFGPGAGTPPIVAIKSPADGRTVQPGFVVKVNATDDTAVDHVTLAIDGAETGVSVKTPPYWLVAPAGIADGPHVVTVTAYDIQAVAAQATVRIEMGPPCTAGGGCAGKDVCVMGGCVGGPGVPGGLGYRCNADTECLSGHCTGDATGHSYCVETCSGADPATCPNGFDCVPDADVCFPLPDGGGCCSTGGGPVAPLLLGLVVFGTVLRRRS